MKIKIKQTAPEFKLKDKDSKPYSLKDIKSDYIVLYFYPKDNTPGCSIEAMNFSNDKEKYDKLNAKVIGISGGDEKSKTKFCEKNNLSILLLSDTDFSVSKKYEVYGKKSFMGKNYMGINRTTIILDKKRKIIKIFENVKPIIHSKEVLEYLNSIKA
jgi:thioredoxin-dependent peroxiredoxin